jgi:heat shock protein HslJ
MTLAECEPGSLYDVLLARLGEVVTYVIDEDGSLAFNLKMDAGNMVFGTEPAPAIPSGLVGRVWYWQAFEDSADGDESNDIIVSDPTKYTLDFLAGGMVNIQADCNSASSKVTVEGSSLSFAPGPMTLVKCEPGSLYDVFLARLGDVVTYVIDEDSNLVLNLKMDAGNMIFGPEGSGPAELDGTSWILVGQGSADDLVLPLPDTEITIDFKNGQVTGSAGCNNYFADYTLTAEGNLQIGPAASTMMACPEEIMQQEIDYLAALAGTDSFTLDEGILTIYTNQGNLVFKEAQDLTLEGQGWTLSGIVQNEAIVSTAIDSRITAEFSGEQVAGFAGCNSYSAGYEKENYSLVLGLVSLTMMTCDDETNQREAEFLSALESVEGYDISRNTLTLTDAGGNALLIFQAQEDSQA